MCKKFLLIAITLFTLSSLTGCSLFSSDSEEQETAVAEETEGENPEDSVEESDASVEEETGDDTESDKEEVAAVDDEEEVVDEYPDDDYGDEEETEVATKTSSATTTAASDEPVETQEESLYVEGSDDSGSTSYAESNTAVQDSYNDGATKAFLPVLKMKKTPYTMGGVLVNRLYIAREGDTLKSVSQKIYGDGARSKDLLTWNPNFAGKGLNVGDKVYYSSPRNPQDSSAILLFYEEAGIQPSYYTTKNGETINKVSKTLLGHPRSWMEVWATNDVEEKWDFMPKGTQLRYWPNGTTAAPVQAAVTPEPTQPEEEMAPAQDVSSAATTTETAAMDGDMGEPPADSQPMEEPPVDDSGAAAAMAQNEEPPPPPPEAAAPPPPPPPEAIPTPGADQSPNAGLADVMGGENDSMTMAILGGLLLLAAMILVIFIRRGRKKAYG